MPTAVHGIVTVVCVIVGAFAYLISRRSNETPNSFHRNREQQSSTSTNRTNARCAFCYENTSTIHLCSPPEFRCSHQCHYTCYMRRSPEYRECPICRNENISASMLGDLLNQSQSSLSNEPGTSHDMPLNITNDIVHAPESSADLTDQTDSTNQVCGFCNMPIENLGTKQQCGHWAHRQCYRTFKERLKCRDCVEEALDKIPLAK